MMRFINIFVLFCLFFILISPALAFADFEPDELPKDELPKEFKFRNPLDPNPEDQVEVTLRDILDKAIKWLKDIAIVIAIGFLAWGGLKFVMAGGDETKVTQGKKIITYAVLGIVLILGASIFIGAVENFLSGKEAEVTSTDLYDKFIEIMRYFYGIVLSLSVIFFARGGLLYLTAKGDAQKISTARKSTLYGIIGIGIIIGVWFIIVFISNLLNVDVPTYPF